jgi:hypothetical protein
MIPHLPDHRWSGIEALNKWHASAAAPEPTLRSKDGQQEFRYIRTSSRVSFFFTHRMRAAKPQAAPPD